MWQFIKGSVRVQVTGFGIERFLNMAAFKGIYLWDVKRTPEGLQMNVSILGFKMLKSCAKKTKCRTKIVQKNGLPFLMFRYRKRKLMMGGIFIFLLGMLFLSSFVWRIEIIGNESLPQEAVMAFANEQGLRIGSLKWNNDDRALQQSILNNFPELSWADIHTRGTRTVIMVSEAIPHQEIVDRQTPAHIIAAADGLITNIVTGVGAPMVRQNDVVREGELLVSGILEVEPDTPGTSLVYVHAYAEIWARRYHPIKFSVPLNYVEKIPTGQTIRRHEIQLLFAGERRLAIPSGRNPFNSYDRVTTRHQPGANGDYPMPFVLITSHYIEFTPRDISRTTEQAKELAEQMITSRIIREFDFAIDIIDSKIEFQELDEMLIVSALITTHERIDKQIPITVG